MHAVAMEIENQRQLERVKDRGTCSDFQCAACVRQYWLGREMKMGGGVAHTSPRADCYLNLDACRKDEHAHANRW